MDSSYIFLLFLVVFIIIALVVLYLYEFTDVFGKKYKLNKDEKNILKSATNVQKKIEDELGVEFNWEKTTDKIFDNSSNLATILNSDNPTQYLEQQYNELEEKVNSNVDFVKGFDNNTFANLQDNIDSITSMVNAYKVENDTADGVFNYIIGDNSSADSKIKMMNEVTINSDLKICNTEATPTCYKFNVNSQGELLINNANDTDTSGKIKMMNSVFNIENDTNTSQVYHKGDFHQWTDEDTTYSTTNRKTYNSGDVSNWAIGYTDMASKDASIQKQIFDSKGLQILSVFKTIENTDVSFNSSHKLTIDNGTTNTYYVIYPFNKYIKPMFHVDATNKYYSKIDTSTNNFSEEQTVLDTNLHTDTTLTNNMPSLIQSILEDRTVNLGTNVTIKFEKIKKT